ncbi:uncharacterized protein FTJAE_2407 [Fusarium tjaetaba]|uniref:F-box domain-containing protein n=1 Tax=Fusarium tjaetaba TaxID=1567544 RepID=A0A8H5W3W0_9HYPO|nr:uncharacterized protein FTJAE_2407 [Fusarium tjaetaba]KAF5645976.1 hypothetical protein FTJAE_2407 [Fusarium tjaetaba]
METQPGEERAVATMNNLRKPTPSNLLEKMPREVIFMIASQLPFRGVMVATLVSKQLRSALMPLIFNKITFSGDFKALSREMRSILNGELGNFIKLILPHAKVVTIRIEPCSFHDIVSDSHLWESRIAVISEFISKLSCVDTIDFAFRNYSVNFYRVAPPSFDDPHLSSVLESLSNTPKWDGPKTVIFSGQRNRPSFTTIMRQFTPDSVKAVHLPRTTAWGHRAALQATMPSLKGLKYDITRLPIESTTLACIDQTTLRMIHQSLPHLHSLVICQMDRDTFMLQYGPITKKPRLPNLSDQVAQLIGRLKEMQQLRRFAFALDMKWTPQEYSPEAFLEVFERLRQADSVILASEDIDWTPFDTSKTQDHEWHSNLVTHILDAVPQLKELCVLPPGSRFYRGTKTEGVVSFRQVNSGDPGEESRFPNRLLD